MSPKQHGFPQSEMRLYDRQNRRLYINAEERKRFFEAASNLALPKRVFGLTLLYTGCRLSEGLALTTNSVEVQSLIVCIRTLKKRKTNVIREVPIPPLLSEMLWCHIRTRPNGASLWPAENQHAARITGYRWIKDIMQMANIHGVQASPKGLRHGFGVHALRCGIPLNMLSKWMGHASIETTSIYTNAVGKEEQEIAARMWD